MLGGAVAGAAEAADMADVKALYASASYEEALKTLSTLDSTADAGLVEQYRALCLLALGRTADAEAALEALVTQHPGFTVQENEVSPRLVTLYRDVRARALPVLARREYGEAKAQFDKGQFETAEGGFARVLGVIGEAGAADPSLADLRLLSEGFARLARANAAAARPAPAPPAPEPAPAAAAAPVEPSVFDASYADVVPPEELSRFMPPWTPRTPMSAATTFRGTIQIVIDEQGEVTSATLAKPLTPEYDNRLLAAARNWKFRPAMREGRPVKFTSHIDIVLKP
jgi:TonB family protein